MNRLSPRARRAALRLTLILALGLFPALLLTQLARSGRKTPHQMIHHARLIAGAVREAVQPAELAAAGSSTEVFNRLLQAGQLQESWFSVPAFEPLKRRTDGDGILQPEENGFALVAGLPEHAPAGSPLLLWDPELVGDRRLGRFSLARGRWLAVDTDRRASLRRGRAPVWWRERRGDDLLPDVPGEQRLLRP